MSGSLVLVAPAGPVRTSLAGALGRSGARVTVDPPGGALAEAVAQTDPDAIVHVVLPVGPAGPVPLEQFDTPDWVRRVHDPMWALVETLRTAQTARVAVVVVIESTGLSGAPGATASSAVAEGARAIAKSAARSFGGDGPAVQMVAVDPAVLGSEDVIGATIRPRNRPAPDLDDLAEAIHAARHLPAGIGGGLLVVDGGRTMLP